MRTTMRVLAVLLAVLALAPGAPKGGDARVDHVDFGETVVDGYVRKPALTVADGRVRPVFTRLANLRKSFLEPILESAKDPVFR